MTSRSSRLDRHLLLLALVRYPLAWHARPHRHPTSTRMRTTRQYRPLLCRRLFPALDPTTLATSAAPPTVLSRLVRISSDDTARILTSTTLPLSRSRIDTSTTRLSDSARVAPPLAGRPRRATRAAREKSAATPVATAAENPRRARDAASLVSHASILALRRSAVHALGT
jgi:hypothetical protein